MNSNYVAVLLFVSAFIIGIVAGLNLIEVPAEDELYNEDFEEVADSDNPVRTVSFDNNRSIGLSYENGEDVEFYLDLTGDGSFETELQNLTRDGQEHHLTRELVQDGRTYQVYLSYLVSEDEQWIRLYRIQQI